MKNIAFIFPARADFYLYPLSQLAEGFRQAGYKVLPPRALSSLTELETLLKEHNPEIIFDINRMKSDWETIALTGTTYITWVIDTWGRDISQLGSSDIVYFFLKEWLLSYGHPQCHIAGYLIPGTTAATVPVGLQKKYDWIFAGHMPKPWSALELSRPVELDNGNFISFQDVAQMAEKDKQSYVNFWIDEKFISFLNDKLRELCGAGLAPPPPGSLRYDLGHRINRQLRRYWFIRGALAMGGKCRLFGSDGWLQWPEFQELYGGFIQPAELNEINISSRLILHEGPGIHFRLLDAMAHGCPVLVHDLHGIDGAEVLLEYFNGDTDLIISSIEEMGVKGRYYLEHEKMLTEIGRNGSLKIKKYHLWIHRALQIIKDIKDLQSR